MSDSVDTLHDRIAELEGQLSAYATIRREWIKQRFHIKALEQELSAYDGELRHREKTEQSLSRTLDDQGALVMEFNELRQKVLKWREWRMAYGGLHVNETENELFDAVTDELSPDDLTGQNTF